MSVVPARKSPSRMLGVAGGLAIAWVLAMTSPGVQIARAADPAPVAVTSEAPPDASGLVSIDPLLVRSVEGSRAPSCSAPAQAGVADEAVAQELWRMVEQEARRLATLPSPSEADGDHVVLNGRGYNYSHTQRAAY